MGHVDRSAPSALVDVVFVHGLAGNGISTWIAPGAVGSFPEWLSDDFGPTAVWSLHYPAAATKWRSRGEGMEVTERAKSLIPTMLFNGIGTRKTIFVCHSLGGLIVKQILRHSADKRKPGWECIAESTLGVVFLATPHSGSFLADIADIIPFFRPTRTTLALGAHSPSLHDLDDWYRGNVDRLGIETEVYIETQRLKRIFRWARVVNPTSSDPHIPGCPAIPVDANHIDICKLASRETPVYQGVSMFLQSQIARAEAAEGSSVEALHVAAEMAKTAPPPDLVQQILELQALREQNMMRQDDFENLRMGILRRHYGVDDE